MSPEEIAAGIRARNFPKGNKPRRNLRKELNDERNKTLDEAIVAIKDKMRSIPKEWHRGYYSAITQLEILKNGKD